MYQQPLEESIKAAIDEIRPYLARHAGGIEFVGFEKGTVYVRMTGACDGCLLSALTLKAGVEELLKMRVHEIERVEAVS